MKRLMELAKKETLPVIVIALYVAAAIAAPGKALAALKLSFGTAASVALIIMSVFAGLGLFGVLVDKQAMGRRLGKDAGLGTLLMAAGFGTILVGPVYAVFPLLKAFKDHGARWAVIATVMTAWALKVPMIPLEIRFLGWQFSLARGVLILVAAVVMGVVFEWLMNATSRSEQPSVTPELAENEAV